MEKAHLVAQPFQLIARQNERHVDCQAVEAETTKGVC